MNYLEKLKNYDKFLVAESKRLDEEYKKVISEGCDGGDCPQKKDNESSAAGGVAENIENKKMTEFCSEGDAEDGKTAKKMKNKEEFYGSIMDGGDTKEDGAGDTKDAEGVNDQGSSTEENAKKEIDAFFGNGAPEDNNKTVGEGSEENANMSAEDLFGADEEAKPADDDKKTDDGEAKPVDENVSGGMTMKEIMGSVKESAKKVDDGTEDEKSDKAEDGSVGDNDKKSDGEDGGKTEDEPKEPEEPKSEEPDEPKEPKSKDDEEEQLAESIQAITQYVKANRRLFG